MDYLEPYRAAVRRHGAGFGALLWASPTTQAARFTAFTRLMNLRGKSVLDVGCGRADLLDFFRRHGTGVGDYTGIEAVDELVQAARAKCDRTSRIVHADFVSAPHRLLVGADVVLISGSLNTMDRPTFYAMLRRCYDAAGEALVFNFLCAEELAAAPHLTWHNTNDVLAFARTLTGSVSMLNDYLDGDCTVAMRRGEKDEG